MPSVDVRPLSLGKDTLPFLRFPWTVYARDAHWVPPLISE